MFNVIGLFFFLFSIFFGSFRLPRSENIYIEVTSLRSIIIGFVFILLGWIFRKSDFRQPKAAIGWAVAIIIYFLSDIPFRSFGFMQPNNYSFELLISAIAGLACLFIVPNIASYLICFTTILVGIVGFYFQTGGQLIFSDDHPSFLFRLLQLKENFPMLPFYNPLWNAGVEAREFFPSGSLNVFFLFLPFIYASNLIEQYSNIVVIIVFLLCPISLFTSSRLLGLSRNASCCSTIIGTFSSILWFRWALSFGTLGFIISSIMLLPVIGFACSLFNENKNKYFVGIGLYLTFSLMIFWSLSAIFIIPISILTLLNWKEIRSKVTLLLLLILLAVTHLPWMVVFVSASNVFNFVSAGSSQAPSIKKSEQFAHIKQADFSNKTSEINVIQKFRHSFQGINPLIILFTLPGIFLIKNLKAKLFIGSTILWLGLIGVVGNAFKPQLELERFLIVAGILASIPAGAMCAFLIEEARKPNGLIPGFLVLSFLAYSPYWIYKTVTNKTSEKYHVANHLVWDLKKIIEERKSTGRVMFAGFTLHELSHGHVAPLPAFTGAPIIASGYQHDRWLYTDVIPKKFRDRKEEGVLEYLNLMNVSTIITHDHYWRSWYEKRHNNFIKIGKSGRFTVFKNLNPSNSYFLQGVGEISLQSGSAIHVKLNTSDAVLKFNYYDFLQAPGCEIKPEYIHNDIKFIKLTKCLTNQLIEISSISPRKRFFR